MSSEVFRFKRFDVRHDKCAMKVGTDGVLLGAWARVNDGGRVLDVGCGSGLVSLMLTQRFPNSIFTGIDIDECAVAQCNENFERAAFRNWECFALCDVKVYSAECRFSTVVSNPPFFDKALASPEKKRAIARQTGALGFADLIDSVCRLLCADGSFSVIVPYSESDAFVLLAAERGLCLSRRTDVRTKQGGAFKRSLLEFVFSPDGVEYSELQISGPQGYTSEFKALTKDFYLDF